MTWQLEPHTTLGENIYTSRTSYLLKRQGLLEQVFVDGYDVGGKALDPFHGLRVLDHLRQHGQGEGGDVHP